MKSSKMKGAYFIDFEDVLAKEMEDPEFAAEWERHAPQREIMKMLIEERIKRKATQKQLATQIGVKQSSLARLESGRHLPSISFLSKVADALGWRLELRLVPKS